MQIRRIDRFENSNIEIRNNIKIQMFEIRNKCSLVLSLFVFVIGIFVI
jgi:hypothetical protein